MAIGKGVERIVALFDLSKFMLEPIDALLDCSSLILQPGVVFNESGNFKITHGLETNRKYDKCEPFLCLLDNGSSTLIIGVEQLSRPFILVSEGRRRVQW